MDRHQLQLEAARIERLARELTGAQDFARVTLATAWLGAAVCIPAGVVMMAMGLPWLVLGAAVFVVGFCFTWRWGAVQLSLKRRRRELQEATDAFASACYQVSASTSPPNS